MHGLRCMDHVTLELSVQDARFLSEELQQHISRREMELVHTDAQSLQRAITKDVARLNGVQQSLTRLLQPV